MFHIVLIIIQESNILIYEQPNKGNCINGLRILLRTSSTQGPEVARGKLHAATSVLHHGGDCYSVKGAMQPERKDVTESQDSKLEQGLEAKVRAGRAGTRW